MFLFQPLQVVTPTREATLSKTLGSISGASAARIAVAATLAKTLSAVSSSAQSKVALKGAFAKPLAEVSSVAQGRGALAATLAKTLSAVTSQSSAHIGDAQVGIGSGGRVVLAWGRGRRRR